MAVGKAGPELEAGTGPRPASSSHPCAEVRWAVPQRPGHPHVCCGSQPTLGEPGTLKPESSGEVPLCCECERPGLLPLSVAFVILALAEKLSQPRGGGWAPPGWSLPVCLGAEPLAVPGPQRSTPARGGGASSRLRKSSGLAVVEQVTAGPRGGLCMALDGSLLLPLRRHLPRLAQSPSQACPVSRVTSAT